ncbi:MAG: ADP-ribosylglycohydrolase family protein [Desulfobacterales bacterium]|jgi:ADP-ribosylglycohydrolase
MNSNAKAMVLASFAADSLSLGVHWIYNTNVIDKKWGRVETYIKPERPTYHPTKNLGEFTHYGDQTMLLLESVSVCAGFDLNDFADRWQELFNNYDGYFDNATKTTIENIAAGKPPTESGSGSDDLAGAARIAPLAYVYQNDLELMITSARAQTALTHNNPLIIDTAEYFARVVWDVLQGQTPIESLKTAKAGTLDTEPYSSWIKAGLESTADDTRQVIKDLGQMCEVDAAFPGVVHLIAKYENDLYGALVENAMAGGDSAGRGLIVGLVVGAHMGMQSIPDPWLTDLKAYDHIMNLLENIDLNQ